MSDSVRPQRRQPTRLPHPWDSPGKSTGVGCHFLLQCMKVKSESEVAQLCPTLSDPMDCSLTGSSVHGIFQARVLEWGAIAFSRKHASSPHKQRRQPQVFHPPQADQCPGSWVPRVTCAQSLVFLAYIISTPPPNSAASGAHPSRST